MKTITLMNNHRASCFAFLLALLVSGLALAQSPDQETGKQWLREYAGNYDADALLRHSKVRPELQSLLGPELRHLQDNLNVKGPVDVVGGHLSISGNAPPGAPAFERF